MKTVLITGSNGFIGKNLVATLHTKTDYVIHTFDLENTEADLVKSIQAADFIIHLAGVNRPQNPRDFETGNVDFTSKLLSLLEKLNKNIPLIATSSIQARLTNSYGQSKKAMEELIMDWSHRTANKAFIYRLPNVFGKWCRPNYNSAIATFCYNITHNLPIEVYTPSHTLQLAYIDDVILSFLHTLSHSDELSTGYYSPKATYTLTLSEVVDKLQSFHQARKTLLLPTLNTSFDKALYATYLSYLEANNFSYDLLMHKDSRGWLSEFIKSDSCGQIFISKTKPGITRGNHWHHTKTEKFLVIQGSGLICLRQLGSQKVISYNVSGDKLRVIDIPPGYTHSIENIGKDELVTLFWASEVFDKENSDTFFEEVLL